MYCIVLLYCIVLYCIVLHCQNFAAKIILGSSKFSSSTDALRELHILPVSVRIEYKILLTVFKCLHGLAPSYLSELLSVRRCSYNTTAAAKNLLVIPMTHRKIFADRSLSVAGPKQWNVLPDHLRECNCLTVFKRTLKLACYVLLSICN